MSTPSAGSGVSISLVSSLVIRSAETISSRPAWSVIAARTSSATVNPSLAANLAARRMRSGSSPNDRSGGPGVRSIFSLSDSRPPNGSMNSYPGSRAAIALTVKSRRARSSSRDVPYCTSGLREVRPYCSLR